MSEKTILILGGGVGGIVVANELRQKLSRSHRIILVEKNADHAFAPSFLWLMTGERRPEEITAPLHRLVRSGIDVVRAEVTNIDIARRQVRTTQGALSYDYLVIALGAELAPKLIPGLEASFSFYTFEETQKLRKALSEFMGGKIMVEIVLGEKKRKVLVILQSDWFRAGRVDDSEMTDQILVVQLELAGGESYRGGEILIEKRVARN